MEPTESKDAQVLALARDLLDDIELSRLSGEGVVLKASRLARLIEASNVQEWLGYELRGYVDPATSPVAKYYLSATGRIRILAPGAPGLPYFGSLAYQEGVAASLKLKLRCLHVPDVSFSSANPHQVVGWGAYGNPVQGPVDAVLQNATNTSNELAFVSGIRSKVLSLIHSWVVGVYHERLFSGVAESLFTQFKRATDEALTERCSEALAKIPHVYERLAAGEPEAVSHALTTCRRILDALADSLYPPRAAIERDGRKIELTDQHSKNRLREYLRERVASASRRERLNHTLSDLYDRFSVGVHADVEVDEARALLLGVYVFIGEVLGPTFASLKR